MGVYSIIARADVQARTGGEVSMFDMLLLGQLSRYAPFHAPNMHFDRALDNGETIRYVIELSEEQKAINLEIQRLCSAIVEERCRDRENAIIAFAGDIGVMPEDLNRLGYVLCEYPDGTFCIRHESEIG